jgi:16S rRNA (guanine527-N7)-methyltransferase
MKIVKKNISRKDQINSLPNGVIVLKGGDVQAEIQPFKRICEVIDIDMWFKEEWFKGKHIIYVPV